MTPSPSNLTPEALREQSAALRAISRSLLRNDHDAEDVAQDALLKSLQIRGSRKAPGSWRARVARNLAFRQLRKAAARRRWERAAARPEATASTAEIVERIELHRRLVDRVLALEEPYRTTVLLRFWEALRPRQVATRMSVPVATVRTRLRRALAILRGGLDRECGGRAAWSTPLYGWLQRSPSIPGPATILTGIALMTTKVKLTAALIVIAALSWLAWEGSSVRDRAHLSEKPPRLADSRHAGRQPRGAEPSAQRLLREEALQEESPPSTGAPDDGPVLVEPYPVRVLVVDAGGNPIPGAGVEIWDAEKHDRSPPGHSETTAYTGERLGAEPFLIRTTDLQGRCAFSLDRHFVFVHAHKKGVGSSNDRPFSAKRASGARELVIALESDVPLRGLVLAEDGVPVPDAEVWVESSEIVGHEVEWPRAPSPTRTDVAGRFELGLRPRTLHDVHARKGDMHVERRVSTRTGGDVEKEIVLRFPGALSIRGYLLDPTGETVVGRIRVWETIETDSRPEYAPLITSVRTAEDGSFQIVVERHGEYRLLGNADAHANTELTPVRVSAVRPHADVSLRLLEPAAVKGTVLYEDGTPARGMRLFLASESGEDPYYADRPTRHDLFGRVGSIRSADDGSFAFEGVHPGTTYTLTCRPHDELTNLAVYRFGIRPGGPAVRLVLTEEELAGSSITGTVVDDATGEPVQLTDVERVHYGSHGNTGTSRLDTLIEPGRYTVPALSLGVKYGLILHSASYPPVYVGPITTKRPVEVLDARLWNWGRITCFVVDPNGNPVVNQRILIRPSSRRPGGMQPAGLDTNAEGRIERRVAPGTHEVSVLHLGERLATREIDVAPGRRHEVRFTIPR